MRIRICWEGGSITGTLNETPNARAVYAALPRTSRANTWGDEVYYTLPVSATLAVDAWQVVDAWVICYWVQGKSLALPFGPTPVSVNGECRLYTAVNVLGQLDGDARVLAAVRDGDEIVVDAE